MTGRITIRDIAGFCPEEAIWKMMADVTGLMIKANEGYVLTPESIVIDGNSFMIEAGREIIQEFIAPEGIAGGKYGMNQMVWSLGATAYYMATGHIIFGGHGSSYQKEHSSVPLPVLPKGLHALTSVIERCLTYSPDDRIGLKELNEVSTQGVLSCEKQQREKIVSTDKGQKTKVKYSGEKWPEEMIEV